MWLCVWLLCLKCLWCVQAARVFWNWFLGFITFNLLPSWWSGSRRHGNLHTVIRHFIDVVTVACSPRWLCDDTNTLLNLRSRLARCMTTCSLLWNNVIPSHHTCAQLPYICMNVHMKHACTYIFAFMPATCIHMLTTHCACIHFALRAVYMLLICLAHGLYYWWWCIYVSGWFVGRYFFGLWVLPPSPCES